MEKLESIIEKMEKLENDLSEILEIKFIGFDEKTSPVVVKKQIKSEIKKIEKAKACLKKYEELALEIEKISHDGMHDDKDNLKIVKTLDKRKKEEKYVDEVLVVDGKVSTKKIKKKESKEM